LPFEIDGHIYFRTAEVCARAGISRATLLRWLKTGILEKRFKDRRGWGIFTEEDIDKITAEAKRINVQYFTTRDKGNQTGLKLGKG
jgi:predicted site-specific integrase-resolvase